MPTNRPPYLRPGTLAAHVAVAAALFLVGLGDQVFFPPEGVHLVVRWVGALAAVYAGWLIYANAMRAWDRRSRHGRP